MSGQATTDTIAGKRGSWFSETPSGDSEGQSQRETLSSNFKGFETGFFEEQQLVASFGFSFRLQQQVPDIRLVNEHRHSEPGSRAQLASLNCEKLLGRPIDDMANHTAQRSLAVRQLKAWRPRCSAVCVNR